MWKEKPAVTDRRLVWSFFKKVKLLRETERVQKNNITQTSWAQCGLLFEALTLASLEFLSRLGGDEKRRSPKLSAISVLSYICYQSASIICYTFSNPCLVMYRRRTLLPVPTWSNYQLYIKMQILCLSFKQVRYLKKNILCTAVKKRENRSFLNWAL